jgi:hypothetical protein
MAANKLGVGFIGSGFVTRFHIMKALMLMCHLGLVERSMSVAVAVKSTIIQTT